MSAWKEWEARKLEERRAKRAQTIKELPPIHERFPMTEQEKDAALALSKCTFLPGSFEKRFARDMASIVNGEMPQITPKQKIYLWRLTYKFRRQINNDALVKLAKAITDEFEII